MLDVFKVKYERNHSKISGITDFDVPFKEQVDRDLELMKTMLNNQLLTVNEARNMTYSPSSNPKTPAPWGTIKKKTVSCTNCGAPTSPIYACEYCGT